MQNEMFYFINLIINFVTVTIENIIPIILITADLICHYTLFSVVFTD